MAGCILVPVTEREQLTAAARAAGLRLSPTDVVALLPAWKRYLTLVEQLRAAVAPEDTDAID